MRLKRSGIYPHVLDLGTAWYDWTGLPFVFAVWVVRKKAVDEKNGLIRFGCRLPSRRQALGPREYRPYLHGSRQRRVLEIGELREYYRCLRYDLNDMERKGLELFYSCLVRMGELERVARS